MSHQLSSNGGNVWIADVKSGGLWVKESALGHHFFLKMFFQIDVDGFHDTPPKPASLDAHRTLTSDNCDLDE